MLQLLAFLMQWYVPFNTVYVFSPTVLVTVMVLFSQSFSDITKNETNLSMPCIV